eukprot:GHVP01010441.1.p1 GENE.GHVP01010441.1~~GHVP01010441.1.p1  ORF type:complete len:139 (+),score=13.30 GHVP01010441.1:97-513(+)
MELLKKISDDVSNTAVGAPTFVQNDDQEAGGLNFRMISDDTESSAVQQPDPGITISVPDPPETHYYCSKVHYLKFFTANFGKILTPTGSSFSIVRHVDGQKMVITISRGAVTQKPTLVVFWMNIPQKFNVIVIKKNKS